MLRVHEQSVLGWLLCPANHAEVEQRVHDISARHFYDPAHREIYSSILAHAGAPNLALLVTTDLVAPEAHRSVQHLPGGPAAYLSECKDYADMYDEATFVTHVQQVKEAHVRRRRLELHGRAARALEDDNEWEYEAALIDIRRLDEDAEPDRDPADARDRVLHRTIADMAASRYLPMLAEEVLRTRARREAKQMVDAENADTSQLAVPVKLSDLLGEDDEEE